MVAVGADGKKENATAWMRRQMNGYRAGWITIAVAPWIAHLLRYLPIIIVPASKRNSLQLRLKMMELRHT
ncbi:hypothetical protein LT85_1472 [Collimonas arenae]|uniref:Uncharacterized protein n=1 Tax=Collimonas arenae TaxID=279058 RepID=A0A0A1FA25_9BURK|nr:hypothetical protein LT85_1472 [Collimonas arenae]